MAIVLEDIFIESWRDLEGIERSRWPKPWATMK
jgi:hypothetical protein